MIFDMCCGERLVPETPILRKKCVKRVKPIKILTRHMYFTHFMHKLIAQI